MRDLPCTRCVLLLIVLLGSCVAIVAQEPKSQDQVPQNSSPEKTSVPDQTALPDKPLNQRPAAEQDELSRQAREAIRINQLARINGVPYDKPSARDTFRDYVRDTYGLPAVLRTSVRVVYGQARNKPASWGQGWQGFGDRVGSAAGVSIINGNVRYAMELTFHEDLRYLRCNRCKFKAKMENVLLAAITARHSDDGHRFFTLTPTIADFSGPVIAHSLWYPNGADPLQGLISARLVFATRIGGHMIQEFVLDKIHPGLKPQN